MRFQSLRFSSTGVAIVHERSAAARNGKEDRIGEFRFSHFGFKLLDDLIQRLSNNSPLDLDIVFWRRVFLNDGTHGQFLLKWFGYLCTSETIG